MSAPTSSHAECLRAIDDAVAYLRQITMRRRGRRCAAGQAETTDSAGAVRPLASAIDATTPAPSRPKATRAPLEADQRDALTSTDN